MDIVLLQEVDIHSKRSAFIDQVQWLLDNTDLNYGVYASGWRADYIPGDGLGAMDSGNAILSRWPIADAWRIPLALRSAQGALTRYFYLKRNILNATIDIPDQTGFHVVNVHTAAYSKDGTKQKHIDRFKAELDKLNRLNALFVGGGDLNVIPPGSVQVNDFDDLVCMDEDFIADDFTEELTWLSPLYGSYQPAIPLDAYQLDNSRYYSHTVDAEGFWNRKLDYLFTNGEWQVGSGLVHQDLNSGGMATMPLSDHAPVSAVLVLP
jgi:endonuclease/exonuclease/phosphatase family metal-dependent hydrolase